MYTLTITSERLEFKGDSESFALTPMDVVKVRVGEKETPLGTDYSIIIETSPDRVRDDITIDLNQIASKPEWKAGLDGAKLAIATLTPFLRNCGCNGGTTSTGGTVDWDDIQNLPDFADIAFTGAWEDLVNPPALGSAASSNVEDFATAAQGLLADSALQPGDVEGIPAGGTIGQVLTKDSNADYDVSWQDATSGTPTPTTFVHQVPFLSGPSWNGASLAALTGNSPTTLQWVNAPGPGITGFNAAVVNTVTGIFTRRVNATGAKRVRLITLVSGAHTSPAAAKLHLRYKAFAGGAVDTVAANYLNMGGATDVEIAIPTAAAATYIDSGWITLDAGAQDDIIIALLYSGGDAAGDPTLVHVQAEFEYEVLGGGSSVLADGDYGDITVGGTGTTMMINNSTIVENYLAADVLAQLVPSGGTTGQVLKKLSNTDHDLVWANEAAGITLGDVADYVNNYTFGGLTTNPVVPKDAQKTGHGEYKLDEVYGLTWWNGSMMLKHVHTWAEATVKFRKFISYFWENGATLEVAGEFNDFFTPPRNLTQAQIEDIRWGSICHNEAYFQGKTNHIIWPNGFYLLNFRCIFGNAPVKGKGTFVCYLGMYQTTLSADLLQWVHPTDPTANAQSKLRMDLLQSRYAHQGSIGGGTYLESYEIDGFRLEGNMQGLNYNNTFFSCGIKHWSPGENAIVGTVYAYGFNGCGVYSYGATPLHIKNLSTFRNTVAGLGIESGGLSTILVDMISGDDNPALIKMYGTGSGGNIFVAQVKSEAGSTAWSPNRPQMILHAIGPAYSQGTYGARGSHVVAHFASIQYAMSHRYNYALMAVEFMHQWNQPSGNPDNVYPNTAFGRVKVSSLQMVNLPSSEGGTFGLFHEIYSGKLWRVPNYTGDPTSPQLGYWHTNPLGFTVNARGPVGNYRTLTIDEADRAAAVTVHLQTGVPWPGAEGRYGWWANQAAYNGIPPVFDPTGGVPPALPVAASLFNELPRIFGAALPSHVDGTTGGATVLTATRLGINGQEGPRLNTAWSMVGAYAGVTIGATVNGQATVTVAAGTAPGVASFSNFGPWGSIVVYVRIE
jgi:hypothetical protein